MTTEVNHPSHYQGQGIECIDAMIAAFGEMDTMAFCKLNAFKYIWRAEKKENAYRDIEKAIWYLTKHQELFRTITKDEQSE